MIDPQQATGLPTTDPEVEQVIGVAAFDEVDLMAATRTEPRRVQRLRITQPRRTGAELVEVTLHQVAVVATLRLPEEVRVLGLPEVHIRRMGRHHDESSLGCVLEQCGQHVDISRAGPLAVGRTAQERGLVLAGQPDVLLDRLEDRVDHSDVRPAVDHEDAVVAELGDIGAGVVEVPVVRRDAGVGRDHPSGSTRRQVRHPAVAEGRIPGQLRQPAWIEAVGQCSGVTLAKSESGEVLDPSHVLADAGDADMQVEDEPVRMTPIVVVPRHHEYGHA